MASPSPCPGRSPIFGAHALCGAVARVSSALHRAGGLVNSRSPDDSGRLEVRRLDPTKQPNCPRSILSRLSSCRYMLQTCAASGMLSILFETAPGLQGRRQYKYIQRAAWGYRAATSRWCGNPPQQVVPRPRLPAFPPSLQMLAHAPRQTYCK